MANKITDTQHYQNIADAIRAKTGDSNAYTPAQMAAAIEGIPTGGDTFTDIMINKTQKSYTVPADIVAILDYCFTHSPLESIVLPAGLLQINSNAFDSAKITSISIPASVRDIYNYAFNSCSALVSVKFEGQAPALKAGLFMYCRACMTYDFSHCTSVPSLQSWSVFSGIDANCRIIVPDALYEDWIAATNWSDSRIVGHIVKASEV